MASESEALPSIKWSHTSATEAQFQDPQYQQVVLKGLQEYKNDHKFSDVFISVEGCDFACHKLVLSLVSPYFHSMFSVGLEECKQRKVVIQEVNSESFKFILDYVYSGKVTITEKNVQCLLEAANMFQIWPLRDASVVFLAERLCISNCLGIMQLADALACTPLMLKARTFALENFTEVQRNEEFLQLHKKDLIAFMEDDHLNAAKEEMVYHAVMNWYHANPEARKDELSEVFQVVRIPLIEPIFLLDVIDNNPALREHKECMCVIEEAKRFHILGAHLSTPTRERITTQPREIIVLFNGFSPEQTHDAKARTSRNFESFSLNDVKFQYIWAPEGASKGGVAMCASDNDIFVCGGHHSNQLWRYQSDVGMWMECAAMKYKREYHSLVPVERSLYAVAGRGGMGTIEKYDIDNNCWQEVGKLCQPVEAHSCAAFQNKLYVFGGIGGSEMQLLNLTQCFDLERSECGLKAVMPKPCAHTKAVVLKDMIYHVGHNLMCFDPSLNTWLFFERPTKTLLCGVTVYASKIFVCGGRGQSNYSDLVECYDPELNQWSELGRLPYKYAFMGCATVLRQISNS